MWIFYCKKGSALLTRMLFKGRLYFWEWNQGKVKEGNFTVYFRLEYDLIIYAVKVLF